MRRMQRSSLPIIELSVTSALPYGARFGSLGGGIIEVRRASSVSHAGRIAIWEINVPDNIWAETEEGMRVSEGDEIKDLRGDAWKFLYVTPQGKLYVKRGNDHREMYASVFQLKVIRKERQAYGR